MQKVLVTGGSGFIGKEIVKQLLYQGFAVNVLDSSKLDLEGVTLFRGSVLEPELISKAGGLITLLKAAGVLFIIYIIFGKASSLFRFCNILHFIQS